MKEDVSAPYLSVIVPVYKVERYLRECLESIIGQSFQDMEIILVDDGSPDKCPSICDEYAKKDSRIRVIHKENGGSVSARNAGARIASGKYITFVDSDDWIDKGMYSYMRERTREHESDIIVTDYFMEENGKTVRVVNPVEEGLYEGRNVKKLQEKMIYSGYFYEPGICPALWNKWYKRELLLSNMEKVDERISWGDDMACTYPCITEAASVRICRGPCFYHYRIRRESMTKSTDLLYFRKFRYLYEYLDNDFERTGRRDLAEQLLYHKVFVMIEGMIRELGDPCRVFSRGFKKHMKALYENSDVSYILKDWYVMKKLDIPLLYKQTCQAFWKHKTGRAVFFVWIVRVRQRFFRNSRSTKTNNLPGEQYEGTKL